MGIFLRCSRAAYSVVVGPIWPKFELIYHIMHVIIWKAQGSKFGKDQININQYYVVTSIFRRLRTSTHSVVRGEIGPKSNRIQAFIYVLITCKYEKDQIKNSGENMMTLFSLILSLREFFFNTQRQLIP